MAPLNTPLLVSTEKPKLLDQLRSAIRLRHYSIRTEEAYTQWVKRFIFFNGKDDLHPCSQTGRARGAKSIGYGVIPGKVLTRNETV
jgi:hypothetical protein